jgi:putative MFS transporter
MTYVIGPYEFPGSYTDNVIVAVGMAGSSVAGFIALFLINRSRTNYTLFAFGGGFLSLLAILAVVFLSQGLFVTSPILYFYPLLFISMMFSEFAWASRTTLEPEMFSTSWRASSIGLVRVVPMIAYALSIVYTSSLGLVQYIEFNGFIWFIGLLGAIWLKALKIDTSKVSLDYEEDSKAKMEISP